MVLDVQHGIEVTEHVALLVAGQVTGLGDQKRDVGQGVGGRLRGDLAHDESPAKWRRQDDGAGGS